jgi:hypothetical protein
MVLVRIVEAEEYDLIGEVIRNSLHPEVRAKRASKGRR